MQKKVKAFSLAVLLILSLTVSALAATPRWVTTDSCDIFFGFTGSTADCGVLIYGKAGTNKIVVKTTLERYNGSGYSTVKTWEQTVYTGSYTLDSTSGNCVRGDYRLRVNATVYNANGKSDVISEYSTATY